MIYRKELLPISETFIKEQARALRKWKPTFIGWKLLNQLELNDMRVRLLTPERQTVQRRISWQIHRFFRAIPSELKHDLQAEQPNLVHAHFGPDALDAWPLARALGIPMLVTLHGYDVNIFREWWQGGNGGQRMRSYPRRIVRLARENRVHFIAVSEAIRSRAIQIGIPEEKIVVRYIGVDTSTFVPGPIPIAQRRREVLFVGRLVEKKGCRYLIEAMKQVQATIPDAALIVVGDGPLRGSLETFARRNFVNANFLGSLPANQVRQHLWSARVFCLPSITAENGDAEGLPISILEAQSSGIPVITSARGGVGEAVQDAVGGFCFREGDTTELALKLTQLLSDDALAKQFSEESVRRARESFDIRNLTAKLEDTYDATCELDCRMPLRRSGADV